MSSSEDSDDLDTRQKKTQPRSETHRVRHSPSPSLSIDTDSDLDDFGDGDRPRKRVKHIPAGVEKNGPSRERWSDSEGENPGAVAYKKFKSRASTHRKKAVAATKRAKAIDAENNPKPIKGDAGATGVGRQAVKQKKSKGRPETTYGDDVPSDEEGMDHTMPDYVQHRRSRFDERYERMQQSGLALPPAYDEVYFSDNERIQTLRERPDLPNTKPPAPYKDVELPYSLGVIPAPIAKYLREYQVDGAAFLHELFVYQKGGILGDDMGLGKTIQVIAFLTAAYGKTADERDEKRMRKMRRQKLWYPKTLIICPGSLMGNWQDELNRWGWWHSARFHGSAKIREDVLSQANSGMIEIMITTYDSYRIYASQINTIAWDCVIADECHTVKDRRAEITKAMNQINSLCRIGLTGTPIQNKYEELWTILNWSNPGTFGPLSTWKYTISEPLKMGQSHNATTYELARARTTAQKLVQNLLPQFFVRRMKSLIKDQLPKKSDRVVFCPLTPAQADAYVNFLESDYVQTIKTSTEFCDCGSKKKAGWCCNVTLENGDKWQEWVFPCIQYLHRLSNHLALLIPSSNDEKKKQAKDVELLQVVIPEEWRKLVETRDNMANYMNPEFCGKWRVLNKLLKFWHGQGSNKVLVFSHSVRLLKMLQQLFLHTSYNVKYLDGSMNYEDRYETVNEFNTDPTQFVFLISTRAGGVGLNITSANKVVVVDPNWNPSYDIQAQDRAYRIGQRRDVEVFRLVSQGTLEEIMYARQIYKQQMSNIGLSGTSERRYFTGVQDRPSQKGEIFGLQNLFAYQNENVVLRDIVHKTNVAEARADLRIAELDLDAEESEDESLNGSGDEDQLSRAASQLEKKADAAMSQLAAEIRGETKSGKTKSTAMGASFSSATTNSSKKHDPIHAILASAGVSYTHENSEVVGTSRVEAALSKRAADGTANATQREAQVFLPASQGGSRKSQNIDDEAEFKYTYKPPEDVLRRQFCSMAKWGGYPSDEGGVIEFALIVESWTQAERRGFLEKWYKYRRQCMINGVNNLDVQDDEDGMDVKLKQEDVKVEVESEEQKDEGLIVNGQDEMTILSDEDDEL